MAEGGGSVQPLIDALRERRRLRDHPQTLDVDDVDDVDDLEALERHALRQVLTLCSSHGLEPQLRVELLHAAYAIVGPDSNLDALLRSDYASALHRWLDPDDATLLLSTNGRPSEPLPLEHPHRQRQAMTRTLTDWGVPETAARRLLRDPHCAWAHRKLFEGKVPCVLCLGSGPGLSFKGGDREFDDAQVDALLTVCEAWNSAERPDLALDLMKATWQQAFTLERDGRLLERWQNTQRALERQSAALAVAPAVPSSPFARKVFAPWLTVTLTRDPSNGLITDATCAIDQKRAAGVRASARLDVLKKLIAWLKSELGNPGGLPWPLLEKVLETLERTLGPDFALEPRQWLRMALMAFERSGDAQPLLLQLSSLSQQQHGLRQGGHTDPVLNKALLERAFAVAKHEKLDAVSRANVIQNALPLLPARDGPGAASHAACLLAVLALDDRLIQRNLFDAYCEAHPFAGLRDLTPRLFELAGQLNQPEKLRSEHIWKKFEGLPRPGECTAWPLWRALCGELARRTVPRILEVQQSVQCERQPFNRLILVALHRLSTHKRQAALSAKQRAELSQRHQAELLADLTEAIPAEHRRDFLAQLHAACLDLIQSPPAPEPGARGAPDPASWISLRDAIETRIDALAHATPPTSTRAAAASASPTRPKAPGSSPSAYVGQWQRKRPVGPTPTSPLQTWLHIETRSAPGQNTLLVFRLVRPPTNEEHDSAQTALLNWMLKALVDATPWDACMDLVDYVDSKWTTPIDRKHLLDLCLWEVNRSGQPGALMKLLPKLAVGASAPDTTILSILLEQARHVDWSPVIRASLLQSVITKGWLPDREGAGAALHAETLQAILDLSDAGVCAHLLSVYRKHHPFAPGSEHERLFDAVHQLMQPRLPADIALLNSLNAIKQREPEASALVWFTLSRALLRGVAPALFTLAQSREPAEAGQANKLIRDLLRRLAHPQRGDKGKATEDQFDLLAELANALPPEQRAAFFARLDQACAQAIRHALEPHQDGTRRPVPVSALAMRGAIAVLSAPYRQRPFIAVNPDDPPLLPVDKTGHAVIDSATRFFADWFRALQLERQGVGTPRERDLNGVRLAHTAAIQALSLQQLGLDPSQRDPLVIELVRLMDALFCLHGLQQ